LITKLTFPEVLLSTQQEVPTINPEDCDGKPRLLESAEMFGPRVEKIVR
jgi:hypothetical protein